MATRKGCDPNRKTGNRSISRSARRAFQPLGVEVLEPRQLLATLLGPEFAVNDITAGDQIFPSVAAALDGSFVATWDSVGEDGDGHGVFARRFDALGQPRGLQFAVAATSVDDQLFPAVALGSANQLVFVWEGADEDGRGVFARLFDAAGQPRGSEFRVHETPTGDQLFPRVASAGNGNFVVVWHEASESGQRIFARQFAPDGVPLGEQVLIDGDEAARPAFASVAGTANGFAVAWERATAPEGPRQICFQQFDAQGHAAPAIAVTDGSRGDALFPTVGGDSFGTVVVSWTAPSDDGYALWARRYTPSGPLDGDPLAIGDSPGRQPPVPSLAMGPAGDFVVAWDVFAADGDGRGTYVRQFDAFGEPQGNVLQLNTTTANDQKFPVAASAAGDSFVAVWDSYSQDGDGHGVFGQRLGVVPSSGSISGYVYADVNNNGVKDPVEVGLPNVPITASGPITVTVVTGPDGYYEFRDLPAGVYDLCQFQPSAFVDGLESSGVPASGTVGQNEFLDVALAPRMEATVYNFGERGLRPELVSKKFYLASTPPVQQQLVTIDGLSAVGGYAFHADRRATLVAEMLAPQSAWKLELYTTSLMPVDLNGDGEGLATILDAGQDYFLYVAGLAEGEQATLQLRTVDLPLEDSRDVNRDGLISPLDALLVINELNRGTRTTPSPDLDVNRDGVLSPLDALRVVNYLNGGRGEGELSTMAADDDVRRPIGYAAAVDVLLADPRWIWLGDPQLFPQAWDDLPVTRRGIPTRRH